MAFTDIRFDLVSKLPAKARPYAILMRLDRPIGWWLLLLPGWWGIALASGGLNHLGGRGFYLMALFWIGAIVMRAAGCVINDLWDRDLDRRVARTANRPLASGALRAWQAGSLLFFLLMIGLTILVMTPHESWLPVELGFLSMLFVVAYPYMKRITWWPQAFLGITFNFGVLIGWAAVKDRIELETVLMYAGAFFWTLGYDTIYAHQDRADDQMVGIKSTALLFGRRSRAMVAVFYAAAWTLLTATIFLSTSSILSQGLTLLPGIHMLLQVLLWRPDDPASSLRWFKSNRDCGLLFFLCFLVVGL